MTALLLVFVLLTVSQHGGECVLQLSTYFGNQMMLQCAPQQAVLWGTADVEGDTVTAQVAGQTAVTTTVTQGQWKVALPAVAPGGPHQVTVSSSEGQVTLADVLFGEVWLCSGQSNMVFRMRELINATEELQRAATNTQIRFRKATDVRSDVPVTSQQFDYPWSLTTSPDLEGFSAVCFLFGEYLQLALNRPVGVLQASFSGTAIELWSGPTAIAECASSSPENSVLWNGMIVPLLSATIKGVVWYQGESNWERFDLYPCQIEALLSEWREQFSAQSLQQTSAQFPFGYVQLSTFNDNDDVEPFAPERWAQTANFGYSPNPELPNTFMAVAMDTPDFVNNPSGAVHPRDKQTACQRLLLGALNVAYGQTNVVFQGPFPTSFVVDDAQQTLTVQYDNGTAVLDVRTEDGFEVCCTARAGATACDETDPAPDTWAAATITTVEPGTVTLSTSACGEGRAVGMRYEWKTSPCPSLQCTLYDADTGLPAPPYITLSFV